ncbi:hypothetical protein Trydic_g18960 [Trypoxylus dichotomus]
MTSLELVCSCHRKDPGPEFDEGVEYTAIIAASFIMAVFRWFNTTVSSADATNVRMCQPDKEKQVIYDTLNLNACRQYGRGNMCEVLNIYAIAEHGACTYTYAVIKSRI